jgi:hypothetical protein
MNTIYIRKSDNVLDDEDYPIRKLTLSNNRVVQTVEIHPGVYSFPSRLGIGATIDDIIKWAKYDPTGQHPETYHVVGLNDSTGKIVWFESITELRKCLTCGSIGCCYSDPVNSPNMN